MEMTITSGGYEEKRSVTTLIEECPIHGIGSVMDVNKYNYNLHRLVRVTAWVKWFVCNLKARIENNT